MNQKQYASYPLKWTAILAACLLVTACGGDDAADPSPMVPILQTYEGDISKIGDIPKAWQPHYLGVFEKLTDYSGNDITKPLIVTAHALSNLTDDAKQKILTAKEAHVPLILIQANETQINAFLNILGQPADFTLPEGVSEAQQYAEIFAVDTEEDGQISTWVMYPPEKLINSAEETVWEDSDAFRAERLAQFVLWLRENGKRFLTRSGAQQRAEEAILAQDALTNLTSVSAPYTTIKNFSDRGDIFQLTYNAYTCHSFSEADGVDYDWLYVEQNNQLHSGHAYTRRTDNKYFIWESLLGTDYEIVENYVTKYWTYNAFDDHAESAQYVTLMDSSPENTNNVNTVTSGISYTFGGSVGFMGKSLNGSASANVNISNSTTYQVTDVTIENHSLKTNHDARWDFVFKQPQGDGKYHVKRHTLSDAPLLARGLFQPTTEWLWRIDPKQRDIESKFHAQFGVEYGRAEGNTVNFGNPAQLYYSAGYHWWGYRIPYQNPPLIVTPLNMDFNNTGSYKTMDLTVARDWTVSSDQSWCTLSPTSGTRHNPRVNVTVDPNTTGQDRTAIITATTADGKDQMKMTVFQSRY